MNKNYLAVISCLMLAMTLVVNALANALPINGMNTGEVAALYPSLFTPAGITFSIWSVIYLFLILYIVYQWWWREELWFAEVSVWFWLSCVANASWIVAWHYLYPVASLAIMITLLLTLTRIFLLLQKHRVSFTINQSLFALLPFTLYFAWICVATIANTSAVLVALPWDGSPLSEVTWTIVMMAIASLLGLYIVQKYQLPAYGLVVTWALLGIFIRWNNIHESISESALLLMAFVGVTSIFNFIRLVRKPV
jgi:hypothetical protein